MKSDMRITVTKRMLREGLLRCMERSPISKITVSDLCRESGINRATFYNHYETPAGILRELAREYAEELFSIYRNYNRKVGHDDETALEACFEYLSTHKSELKELFSANAEHCLSSFSMEIINERLAALDPANRTGILSDSDEYYLYAVTTASAMFGLIQAWMTADVDKTPKELVIILKKALRENLLI